MGFRRGDNILTASGSEAVYCCKHPANESFIVFMPDSGGLFTTAEVSEPPRVLKKGDEIYVRDDENDSWADVNARSSVIFHGTYEGMVVCLDYAKQHLSYASLWNFAIHVDDV